MSFEQYRSLPADPARGDPTRQFGDTGRTGDYWTVAVDVPVSLLKKAGARAIDRKRLASAKTALREGVHLSPIEIAVWPSGESWIVDGNHRIIAAHQLGIGTLPTIFTWIKDRTDRTENPRRIRNMDDRRRAVQRAAAQAGDIESEARLMVESMRAGVIEPWRVSLAAVLGSPAARIVFPVTNDRSLPPRSEVEMELDEELGKVVADLQAWHTTTSPRSGIERLVPETFWREASRAYGVGVSSVALELIWDPLCQRWRELSPDNAVRGSAMGENMALPAVIVERTRRLLEGGDAATNEGALERYAAAFRTTGQMQGIEPRGLNALYHAAMGSNFGGESILARAVNVFHNLYVLNLVPPPRVPANIRELVCGPGASLGALARLWGQAIDAFEGVVDPEQFGADMDMEELLPARDALRGCHPSMEAAFFVGEAGRVSLLEWSLRPLRG